MFKKIKTSLIDYNPHRDFKNYPIDRAQVDRLVNSINAAELFGVFDVRPNNGRYELSSGHHRFEAVKAKRMDRVNCEVTKMDDHMMITRMVVENATQRGHNAAANMDSVAAIVKELAYELLSVEHRKELDERVAKIFATQDAYNSAKGKMLKGDGLGERIIAAYAPKDSLGLGDIRAAIGALKNSGQFKRILKDVTQKIEAEEEQAAEEERRAPDKDKEAAAKKKKESKQKSGTTARKASTQYQDKEFDIRVANLFNNTHQLESFRKAVTTQAAKEFIPVDQHLKLAREIKREAENESHLTGPFIRSCVSEVINKAMGLKREMDEQEKLRLQEESANQAMADALNAFKIGFSRMLNAKKGIIKAHERGAVLPARSVLALSHKLDEMESLFKEHMRDLRKVFRKPKNVINL